MENLLLTHLPGDALARLRPSFERVTLRQGHHAIVPDEPVRHFYFPTGCLLSLETTLRDGRSAESGVIGREGLDLFIPDTRLGEGGGVELCRGLRAARPDTPVVFYSAAAFDSDRGAARRAGACAYAAKPGVEGLVGEVRRVVGPAAAS